MGDKVYVGNLDVEAIDKDLEKAFGRFGPIKSIWIARKPPGFAFVTFEDPRDAEDAVAELNGTDILSQRIRVEISHSRDKRRDYGDSRGGGGGGGGRDRYDDRRDRYDDRRGGGGGGGGGGRSRSRSRERPRRQRSDSRDRYARRERSPPRYGGSRSRSR